MPRSQNTDAPGRSSPRRSRLNPFAELQLDDLGQQRWILLKLLSKRIGSSLENSARFDMAIELEKSFQLPIKSLAIEIIRHAGIRDGRNTRAQIEKTVSVLAANLCKLYLQDPEKFVAISRGPQYYTSSRYNCQGIGFDNLIRTMDYLMDRDPPLISYFPGNRNPESMFARSSRIRVNEEFLNYFFGPRNFGTTAYKNTLTENSVTLSFDFELIRLKGPKQNGKKPLIDYEDSAETREMRARLTAWNDFLGQQWVDLYVPDHKLRPPLAGQSQDEEAKIEGAQEDDEDKPRHLDWTDRRLYRVFNNGAFDQGGRFYGGWWQYIRSELRKHITINWHPTRELDFSHMQPAILYAIAKKPLDRYAYEIDGIPLVDGTGKEIEKNKDAIKKTFFKLLYSERGKKIAPLEPDALPTGWTWEMLLDAVLKRHAPISEYFHSGIAPKMQRIDSDIAEDVMHSMMKRNILVLPIHDSFCVRRAFTSSLRDEMLRAYRERMGTDIGLTMHPSFVDEKPPTSRIISKFEEMDASIHQNQDREAGDYAGYYRRRREFLSKQTPEWHSRFEPY
jgi:hypothetical protein